MKPLPPLSITEYALADAAERGDATAFVDAASGRTLSYMQLAFGPRMAAGGLLERGLKKGEVVAIYLPNIPEYAAIFHAIALTGGVAALFSPLLSAEELTRQCEAVGARFIVAAGPLVAAAKQTGVEVIGVGDSPGTTPFLSLLSAPIEQVPVDPATDLAALVLSSGTEGPPKPVKITHQNLVAGLVQIETLGQFGPSDVFLGLLPFSHVYGSLVGLLLPTRLGAKVVTHIRFELFELLRSMQEHRVSVAHLVPPLVQALVRHPGVNDYDLSALRLIISGAAHLPAELGRACAARLGCEVVDGYGLSEAGATHVVQDYAGGRFLGTVGTPLPLTRCRLIDPDTGAPVPAGEVGEICVAGPCITPGYLDRPVETAAMLDAEGWLHTGDLGRVDADGHLHVVDRIKELIKCAGVALAPASVESMLREHPAVADAAVIGQPDALMGEVPVAFVALQAPVEPGELLSFMSGRLPPDLRLRRVIVVESIPRSLAGKILRRHLRETLRETPSPGTPHA